MKIIKRIRAIIRKYRSDRFLKKHNCKTYAQYNYRFDKRIDSRGGSINQYYHGYPYIWYTTNYEHQVYQYDTNGFDYNNYGHWNLIEWCNSNCKGKYRTDALMAYPDDLKLSSLGGQYLIFFAFESERDFLWFSLKWS